MTQAAIAPQERFSVVPEPFVPETEAAFYDQYSWVLNAFPTVSELICQLRREIEKLTQLSEEWCVREVQKNVWLLACAVSEGVDDYLPGRQYNFSRAADVLPVARLITNPMEKSLALVSGLRTATMAGKLLRNRLPAGVIDALLSNLGANQMALGGYNSMPIREPSQDLYNNAVTTAIRRKTY